MCAAHTQALLALAKLDCDAVWLCLTKITARDGPPPAAPALMPPSHPSDSSEEASAPMTTDSTPSQRDGPSPGSPLDASGGVSQSPPSNYTPDAGLRPPSAASDRSSPTTASGQSDGAFPPFRQLCPVGGMGHGSLSSAQPPLGQVAQAQKLLKLVEAVTPAWHAQLDLACM